MNVISVTTSASIDSCIPHTLAELRPGQCARIVEVEPNELADRLSDLGFTEGAAVRCELVSLMGDPLAFRILTGDPGVEACMGRSMIALRKKEARTVHLMATDAESRAVWD